MQVFRTKDSASQYNTTVRLRYPQLHRRLEILAVTALFELIFLAGPFFGLIASLFLPHTLAFFLAWFAAVLVTEVIYYYISVETRLNTPFVAIITAPVAILIDIYMLHVSVLRYEFGDINWRGRNVCIPVMRLEPRNNLRNEVSVSSV